MLFEKCKKKTTGGQIPPPHAWIGLINVRYRDNFSQNLLNFFAKKWKFSHFSQANEMRINAKFSAKKKSFWEKCETISPIRWKPYLEPWNPGIIESWNNGTPELWNLGTMKPLNYETQDLWNPGTLEPWNFRTLELFNPRNHGIMEPWNY